MLFLFGVVIALVAIILLKWIRKRRKELNLLKSLGIPGPQTSSFFFGNLPDLRKKSLRTCMKEWTQKYGKVFGYYEGGQAIVAIADPDMVREALIKRFHIFCDRMSTNPAETEEYHTNVVTSKGENWKRMRSILTPVFTAQKMKRMTPIISSCIDKFITNCSSKADSEESFDIHLEFQKLTLDVIGSCAFGFDPADSVLSNVFLHKCQDMFKFMDSKVTHLQTLYNIKAVAPWLLDLMAPHMGKASLKRSKWFFTKSIEMMHSREINGSKRIDLLHLMLNATDKKLKVSDMEVDVSGDNNEITDVQDDHMPSNAHVKQVEPQSTDMIKRALQKHEIASNCSMFLLAGYETTSTALCFVVYDLVTHPEAMKKLCMEVDEHYPSKDMLPDYDSVHKLKYLDMVLNETLRLHTISEVGRIRKCYEDCVIKGVPIRKGMYLQVNNAAIHMDDELWGPEPVTDFVPERFSPERCQQRHPCAFIPFGTGPRNCIGMRFSLLEAKMAIVRLLQNFTVYKCDRTPEPPIPCRGGFIYAPIGGVWIKLCHK